SPKSADWSAACLRCSRRNRNCGSPAMRNGRKLLYHPGYVQGFRNVLAQARGELAEMSFRHACDYADRQRELAALREELEETRLAFEELKTVVRRRQDAEHELAELFREREISRARMTVRDDVTTVH